jgi:pyruvate kinase
LEKIDVKKTKILCTIGPASMSRKILRKMFDAGMDGVRINTVFGDFGQFEEYVENVRSISELPILLDISGIGIRTRMVGKWMVNKGDVITLGSDGQSFGFNYDIFDQLSVGDKIFIDDGRVQTEVVKKKGSQIQLLMKNDGILQDRKGVNIPNKSLKVPVFSNRDLKVIDFAKEHDIEFISLSFARSREDVLNLRKRLGSYEASMIAKIENFEGVSNFEEILREAQGIMIARGDLGVEMELEKVPLLQKRMISRCNQQGKIVITATDMLDSMINSSTPTRAEISDVANAILDGTDVLMLSGETSLGKYPVEAVSVMARIADQAEALVTSKVKEEEFHNISSTISRSVQQLAETMPLDKVVTMTKTGYTARMIARLKLKQPIIAVTASGLVKKQLALVYGVNPIQFDYGKERDKVLSVAQMLCNEEIISEKDTVLFTAGLRTPQKHSSNIIEIHTIKELMEYSRKNDYQSTDV